MEWIKNRLHKIKPRDQNDYYPFFGWLVSRRLAFAAVAVTGILGAYYIFCLNPPSVFTAIGDGIWTYQYNSIPLRFVSGKVRIRAKSGYIAYEGEVERGKASGFGTLYGKNGKVLYTGTFKNNKYHGSGMLFYADGQLQYTGEFLDNEFSGSGKLYRQNGSMEYEGGFLQGKKEGAGTLYDSGNTVVFTGNFSKNQIIYEELLEKRAEEISSVYSGRRTVYYSDEDFAVALEDIHALYQGSRGDSLDADRKAEQVFVWENYIQFGDMQYTRIEELEAYLGSPVYEGNTCLTVPEAVCLDYLNQNGITLLEPAAMSRQAVYDDVIGISELENDYMIYLYTFEYEGILYSFYCRARYGEFAMYRLERG